MTDRRTFLKKSVAAAAALASMPTLLEGCARPVQTPVSGGSLIVPKGMGLPITGTFLDEISHDIPHQNWGAKEWEQDFVYMKAIGIKDVIVIRCGHKKFITYPSPHLLQSGCYMPSVDLIELFCSLADKYDMNFWFGLYDSGVKYPEGAVLDMEHNKYVIEEVWTRYGHHKSFAGWYLSKEFSNKTDGMIEAYRILGKQCKELSGNLPTFISPYINGKKAVSAFNSKLGKAVGEDITLSEHERQWNEILDGIRGYVDACAFQDGHVDYDELDGFLTINKQLADRYGIESWTNAESFDRDMPIKFLPIKFDKLRLKLESARRCGYDKAITFEFSHFMSPQSAYLQAGHLYDRYAEYFGLNV
ncbi:MAG: DUF4434 domain-containing protein [Bacteroidales bacterium]|nr:DUF4434 domain-containing protein [Bacteroidales bacterium]MBQ9597512.1 DUF4434 domain-containing protein [Bacteroidales bacterium]